MGNAEPDRSPHSEHCLSQMSCYSIMHAACQHHHDGKKFKHVPKIFHLPLNLTLHGHIKSGPIWFNRQIKMMVLRESFRTHAAEHGTPRAYYTVCQTCNKNRISNFSPFRISSTLLKVVTTKTELKNVQRVYGWLYHTCGAG